MEDSIDKSKVGMYARNGKYISKCTDVYYNLGIITYKFNSTIDDAMQQGFDYDEEFDILHDIENVRFANTVPELIEYGDAMEIDGTIHFIDFSGKDGYIRFLNLAFCDGFTDIEDETYMIVNICYLVNIKELKLKSVITKEYMNKVRYRVGGNI